MATIDIKLKSYDELIFEITKLNTDKYLLEQENKQLKEDLKDACYVIEKIKKEKQQAIEYIKENACYGIQEKCCLDDLNYNECDELLEILGEKENE